MCGIISFKLYQRAGWYNLDFINRLAAKDYFYENNQSAERIIPELQDLEIGDAIYILPDNGMVVTELVEEEHLLLIQSEDTQIILVWTFMLLEVDNDTTRLCVRWTSEESDDVVSKIMDIIITEPGGIGIQQWQMLKGIKKRAENEVE